jgi:hypothetical protein
LGILQLIECIISILLHNSILDCADQLDEDIVLEGKRMSPIVSTGNNLPTTNHVKHITRFGADVIMAKPPILITKGSVRFQPQL